LDVARRAKGFFAGIPSFVARMKEPHTAHEFQSSKKAYMLLLSGQLLFAQQQGEIKDESGKKEAPSCKKMWQSVARLRSSGAVTAMLQSSTSRSHTS
jgi:hypothetical protein